MQTEVKPEPKKGGRPKGFSPKTEAKGIQVIIEGEYVVLKIPKKDLSRKLLADLI
ncbi:MAG TPA: hypothetical protein V6C65_38920 [Allocoleopsis sp.]